MSIQLKIKVTKDILHKTRHCSISPTANCAIAVAVRDIFPNAVVAPQYIYLQGTNWVSSICLPDEAQEFISDFDRNTPEMRVNMPELEFEVRINDRIIEQLVNIDDIKQLLKDHPTLSIIET